MANKRPCPWCGGTGKLEVEHAGSVMRMPCGACKSKGLLSVTRWAAEKVAHGAYQRRQAGGGEEQ
jgi:DnaJ-class molecular chaperone